MAELRQRRHQAPTVDATDATTSPVDAPQGEEGEPPFSWTKPTAWPLSMRWFPIVPISLLIIGYIYWQNGREPAFDTSTLESCVKTFNYGFRVNAVRHQAEQLSTHSWEYGTAAEAIMELLNPERAVFGPNPFPKGEVPSQGFQIDQALLWVYPHIRVDNQTLYDDDFSVSDPASLGVPTVMVGRRWKPYMEAAERQKEYLLQEAPRYINSAISHRRHVAEVWSDAVAMFPPFLAYYGVHKNDTALIKAAVRQIQLYRDVLSISQGPTEGLWKHIVGPSEMSDEKPWSTGNGWAAYGMARVRATIAVWGESNVTMQAQVTQLDRWIGEILDGAIRTDNDESGLLRNYLGSDSWYVSREARHLMARSDFLLGLERHRALAFWLPLRTEWQFSAQKCMVKRST